MAGVVLPGRFSAQPQVAAGVDWSNPLARGLRIAWLPSLPTQNFADPSITVSFNNRASLMFEAAAAGVQARRTGGTPAGPVFTIPSWGTSAGTIAAVQIVTSLSDAVPWETSTANITFAPYSDGNVYANDWANSRWLSAVAFPGGSAAYTRPHVIAACGSSVANSHAFWINGRSIGSANATWQAPTVIRALYDTVGGYGAQYHSNAALLAWDRLLTDIELAHLTAAPTNLWTVFRAGPRLYIVPAGTPGTLTGDVTTSGWTATPSGAYYATLDEATASDSDYITSPTLGTGSPITMSIESLPAGSYDVQVRAAYAGSAGQVRVVLLNASNVAQGTSSWQALTASATTYTLPVTTTGAATRIRIEVQ